MPDPNDPRARVLANITQSSRAFGRDRRRGEDASTDPAFQAALTERDPERRRAALSEYARGRARDLFPEPALEHQPLDDFPAEKVGPAPSAGRNGMFAALGAAQDGLDEEAEARDTSRIEARQFPEDAPPDGIDQIANAAEDLQRRVTARRRR